MSGARGSAATDVIRLAAMTAAMTLVGRGFGSGIGFGRKIGIGYGIGIGG
ncbi:hypothetical protein [Streptomyces sp. NPDC093544]